jgi:hypothetical protein
MHGGGEGGHEAQGGERSISGDGDVTELEEAWMHCGRLDVFAFGGSAHARDTRDEENEGEAQADAFNEVHGIALSRSEEAQKQTQNQCGQSDLKKPELFRSLFHGIRAKRLGEVKTDPLGRARVRR